MAWRVSAAQVARSLWGPDTAAGEMLAPVEVTYRRLEKGARPEPQVYTRK